MKSGEANETKKEGSKDGKRKRKKKPKGAKG